MEKITVSDRLNEIIRTRGIRQVDILEAAQPYCRKYGVRLTKNALSQYVTGKVRPKQDKIAVLSLALNVSEAWLMGYDVAMERDANSGVTEETLNKSKNWRFEEFTKLYNLLNDDQKTLINHVIKEMINN